jgi:hypothetical protein
MHVERQIVSSFMAKAMRHSSFRGQAAGDTLIGVGFANYIEMTAIVGNIECNGPAQVFGPPVRCARSPSSPALRRAAVRLWGLTEQSLKTRGQRCWVHKTCRSVFHSITSSAIACSVSGTVRPSVLAVLRLMISSIFVARRTGRSAGLSPLRTRPT